jgi:pilus assembly protein CpaE
MARLQRTLIVDSDAESRANLRQILAGIPSTAVIGEIGNLSEALVEAPACHPDVLMVEIPSEDGRKDGRRAVSVIEQLARTLPDTAIFAIGPSVSADLVIQVIRAGALDFLGRPVKRDDLVAALAKVARYRRGAVSERRHGQVTSVFSTKGGVGVTTIATNLAVCWAERASGGALLVDLDTRQSDVATFLNLRHTYSVLDAFENVGRMDESFLRGLLTRHSSGLWVLPGPARMERTNLSAEHVKSRLAILRSHFDHVILDIPHDMDPGTIAALEASDVVLFLVTLSVSALRSGAAGLAAFRHLGLDLQRVRIVVMREGTGEDVTLKHVRETLEMPIYWRTPSDYRAVVTAINSGEPVVTASPRAKIAKNLRQLSDGLFREPEGATAPIHKRAAALLRMAWTPNPLSGGE